MIHLYPQAEYEIWLDTPTGTRLVEIEGFTELSYAKRVNTLGRAQLTLPLEKVDQRLIRQDTMLELWRTPNGQAPILDFVGLARRLEYRRADTRDTLTLHFEDGHTLLTGKVVAYRTSAAGLINPKTTKSGYADNMMKAVVRENLGNLTTNPLRDLTAYGFGVEPDVSAGPLVNLSMPWKRVLDVLQDISDLSRQEGSQVYFEMRPKLVSNTQISWDFVTAITSLGPDRTYVGGTPVVFSAGYGNLESPILLMDYTDEFTLVYAVGQGEGIDRFIQEAQDDARVARSPWSRREVVTYWPVEANKAHLLKWAKRTLAKGRPRLRLRGDLKDTPQTSYGVDWGLGYRVIGEYQEFSFPGMVEAVSVTLDGQGQEKISAQIEAEGNL